MIKSVILLLLIVNIANASEPDCNIVTLDSFEDLARIQVPNCLSDEMLFQEEMERGTICTKCRQDFNRFVSVKSDDIKEVRQKIYRETMFSEYKKAMTTIVSDIISARKLHSTNSKLTQSKEQCSSKNFENKIKKNNCSPLMKDFLDSKNISLLMANELTNMLSNSNLQGALYSRTSPNQCSITDQEITSLKAHMSESLIDNNFASQIAAINPISQADFINKIGVILSRTGLTAETIFKQHPILNSLMSEPTKITNLFKELVANPGTDIQASFRNLLYTQENGDAFDKQTGERCQKSMDALVSKLCSPDFNQGNISVGPIANYSRFSSDNIPTNDVVTNEELLKKNVDFLEFCSSDSPRGLNLAKDSNNVASWLSSDQQNLNVNEFIGLRFEELYQTPRNSLCEDITNDKKCDQLNSDRCIMLNLYKESKQQGTRLYQLASNPDPSVDQILRNLVGVPRGLTPEATRVLVAEGILPQSNGQYVERPAIPERSPDYLANVANGRVTPNTGGTPTAPANLAARSVSSNNARSSDQQTVFQPQESSFRANATNTTQDNVDELAVYRSLNERLSRLAAGPTTVGAAPRVAQAARPPRASTPKSASREENNSAPAFNPSPEASSNFGELAPDQFNAPEIRQAALAPASSTSAEQRRSNAQRNAALSQFESARNNPFATGDSQARNPASESEENSERSISLTVSGDITTGLEQILSNSSTTGQDLRSLINSRESFQLELNGSVYGVNFKDTAYEVSLVNGNRNAARSILTSLERVLNTSLSSNSGPRLQDLRNSIQ